MISITKHVSLVFLCPTPILFHLENKALLAIISKSTYGRKGQTIVGHLQSVVIGEQIGELEIQTKERILTCPFEISHSSGKNLQKQ